MPNEGEEGVADGSRPPPLSVDEVLYFQHPGQFLHPYFTERVLKLRSLISSSTFLYSSNQILLKTVRKQIKQKTKTNVLLNQKRKGCHEKLFDIAYVLICHFYCFGSF